VKIRELQTDSVDRNIRLIGIVAKLKNFADRIKNNFLRMTILEKAFVGSTNSRKRTNQRMKDDTRDKYGMNLKIYQFLY
jgi:hypothetical protein